MTKSVTVQDLVKRFSLEVLAGEKELHRTIEKPKTHRLDWSLLDISNFFNKPVCRCWGAKKLLICIR